MPLKCLLWNCKQLTLQWHTNYLTDQKEIPANFQHMLKRTISYLSLFQFLHFLLFIVLLFITSAFLTSQIWKKKEDFIRQCAYVGGSSEGRTKRKYRIEAKTEKTLLYYLSGICLSLSKGVLPSYTSHEGITVKPKVPALLAYDPSVCQYVISSPISVATIAGCCHATEVFIVKLHTIYISVAYKLPHWPEGNTGKLSTYAENNYLLPFIVPIPPLSSLYSLAVQHIIFFHITYLKTKEDFIRQCA